MHRKSIAMLYTQLPSEIYIYHSTADDELVPDSLQRLSLFCVCSLITGLLLCILDSGELCIPCGEKYPRITGGWVTVVTPEPPDCVAPEIVLCVCNPCIGSPIIPCGGRNPGVPGRKRTVELDDPLKHWPPAIVLWVCNPYSEGSDIP